MDEKLPYCPYSEYLKNKYGEKVYKLPVNLPVTFAPTESREAAAPLRGSRNRIRGHGLHDACYAAVKCHKEAY